MWIKALTGFSAYHIAFSLFQSQIVSDSMLRILEQFPIVVLVIFTSYYTQKQQREDNRQTRQWLEHMLEVQRNSLKEIYESQATFLSTLINQIAAKQEKMSEIMELLTQQVALNTSTVSEIAKVDTIVAELITRLEQK